MGSQAQPQQGLPPGETPPEDEQSRFDAIGTVLGVVAAVVLGTIAIVYFGGWVAHVLTDIARSGWASK